MRSPLRVERARGTQVLDRVRAECLEHRVPGSCNRHVRDGHRLCDQPGQGIEDVPGAHAVSHDGDDRLDSERCGEDAQEVEHDAFALGQQLIGPVDGGLEGAVSIGSFTAPSEELEPFVEVLGDLGRVPTGSWFIPSTPQTAQWEVNQQAGPQSPDGHSPDIAAIGSSQCSRASSCTQRFLRAPRARRPAARAARPESRDRSARGDVRDEGAVVARPNSRLVLVHPAGDGCCHRCLGAVR